MKLSEHTLKILQNYAKINQSIKFTGNEITVKNEDGYIGSFSQIPETFEHLVSIYDLNSFLAVCDFYKDKEPDYEFEENNVVIKAGRAKTVYHYSNPEIIKSPKKMTFDPAEALVKFEMNSPMLKEIFSISKALMVEDLFFDGKDGKLFLMIFDHKKNTTKPVHEVEIENVKTTSNFRVYLKLNSLKVLMDDYDVAVFEKFIYFNNRNKQLEYFIGTDRIES